MFSPQFVSIKTDDPKPEQKMAGVNAALLSRSSLEASGFRVARDKKVREESDEECKARTEAMIDARIASDAAENRELRRQMIELLGTPTKSPAATIADDAQARAEAMINAGSWPIAAPPWALGAARPATPTGQAAGQPAPTPGQMPGNVAGAVGIGAAQPPATGLASPQILFSLGQRVIIDAPNGVPGIVTLIKLCPGGTVYYNVVFWTNGYLQEPSVEEFRLTAAAVTTKDDKP